jgi:hypothetical protein
MNMLASLNILRSIIRIGGLLVEKAWKKLLILGILLLSSSLIIIIYGARSSSPAFSTPDKGLIGYWKFDEGEGDVAFDETGNQSDGILLCDREKCSPPRWDRGRIGYALQFDGLDDLVRISNSELYNLATSDFSLTAWIKVNQASNALIVGKGTWGYESYGLWLRASAGRIEGEIKGQNPPGLLYQVTSEVVTDGNWHFIAATFDRDGYGVMYTDGVPTERLAIGPLATDDISNGAPLLIGQGSPGAFNGLIDEVRIYNRALSEEEVKALYRQVRSK